MEVVQFRYSADNLSYLVHGVSHAIAVDGGAVKEILGFISDRHLELQLVTNTHSHGDHTCGNRSLIAKTGCRLIPAADLPANGPIHLNGERIEIIPTPGHTADSLCLLGDGFLLAGDTLFNGKAGRCFTGDYEAMYRSIGKLMQLPEDTMVYGGHDYVEEYMDFARTIEPGNSDIDRYLEMYGRSGVGATLAWEKRVDPFLRLDEPAVIRYLEEHGMPSEERFRRFVSLFEVQIHP